MECGRATRAEGVVKIWEAMGPLDLLSRAVAITAGRIVLECSAASVLLSDYRDLDLCTASALSNAFHSLSASPFHANIASVHIEGCCNSSLGLFALLGPHLVA